MGQVGRPTVLMMGDPVCSLWETHCAHDRRPTLGQDGRPTVLRMGDPLWVRRPRSKFWSAFAVGHAAGP